MSQILTIRTITTLDEFIVLRRDWTGLLGRSCAQSIFMTHEWLLHWTKHYVGHNCLWILVFEDARRRIKGIAPFYMRRSDGGGMLKCREIAFLGSQHVGSMYLDLLAEPNDHRAVIERLYEYLFDDAARDWDVLTLEQLPAESPTLDALQTLFDQAGKVLHITRATCCPIVHLPRSTAEYRRTLSANTRYNLQRKCKALERQGSVSYRHVGKGPEVAATYAAFIALHETRWRRKGAAGGAFHHPSFRVFHENFITVAEENGWLSLNLLTVDERPLAGLYGFVYGGTYYFYLPGFDPDVAAHTSPGMVLLAHRIEQAIEEGHQRVDLLMGDAQYKETWANARRRTLTICAYNRRLPALWLTLAKSVKELVKIAVR